MAQQDILLPGIEHDTQSVDYWCGPACINIVLSFWDKQQSQADLWESIKTNTGSQYRPADAPSDDGSFKTQRCDACDSGYHCWYTTPEAMATTINALSPQTVSASYQGSQDAIRRMADSLSASSPVPAVFTTLPSLHWVVAVGYQLDGPGDAIVWNGQKLTALYVRDPAVSDPGVDVTQLTTIDGLRRPLVGLLMAIQCGSNAGQHPVVAKGTPPASPVIVQVAPTWQSTARAKAPPWWERWKRWMMLRPRPPRPPRR